MRKAILILSLAFLLLVGGADAGSQPSGNELKGEELIFEVKSATSDSEKASHLGRLAYYEYGAGGYEQARSYGRQAVVLDPENLFPERLETWFIIANASVALKDFKSAKETLTALLAILPPPKTSDVALVAKQLLDSLKEAEKLP